MVAGAEVRVLGLYVVLVRVFESLVIFPGLFITAQKAQLNDLGPCLVFKTSWTLVGHLRDMETPQPRGLAPQARSARILSEKECYPADDARVLTGFRRCGGLRGALPKNFSRAGGAAALVHGRLLNATSGW